MSPGSTRRQSVLVTGANGFIGNAVARAFSRAGWDTFGLVRDPRHATGLARDEIRPVVGSPEDPSFLDRVGAAAVDVVVSNTEDPDDPAGHLRKVGLMMAEVGRRGRLAGVRPLMMFSSGCKDYGKMAERHGDPALAPHTEASPIRPPSALAARTEFGLALLRSRDEAYDATVLRPTVVHGRASGLYGPLLDLAAEGDAALRISGHPDAILHSLHVDDCADAYVSLAEHADRGSVAQQAFNLSGGQYETGRQVAEAVARSYGREVAFDDPPADVSFRTPVHGLFNFSQWVSSDKARALTGWRDRRPAFSAAIQRYRPAREAHAAPGS